MIRLTGGLSSSMQRRIWGRYRWVRGHRHIISPYDDKLRALAMPETCSYFPVGLAPPPAARPPGYVGRWPPCCPRCGHRHAGLPCASHVWDDPCALDAGADCPRRYPDRPVRDYVPVRLLRRSPAEVADYLASKSAELARLIPDPAERSAVVRLAAEPVGGPRALPERVCPGCWCERTDYGRTCPSCGATESPVEAS
jgi:hypothetical protein